MKQLYRYRHFAHISYDLLAKDRTHIEHMSLLSIWSITKLNVFRLKSALITKRNESYIYIHIYIFIHAGIAVDTCCNRGPWRCGEIDLQQVSYWPS